MPDLKRGNFTKNEEETIIRLHDSLGNNWSQIASHLPGRTDNEIKNVWNTYLRKRLSPKNPRRSGNTESMQENSYNNEQASEVTMLQKKEFESANQVPNELNGILHPKNSSSSSSYVESESDFPNSSQIQAYKPDQLNNISNPSQISAYKPEEQMMNYLMDFIVGPNSDVNSGIEEVNKPNPNRNVLEIQFEPEKEFWSSLDIENNMGSLRPKQDQMPNTKANMTSTEGGEGAQESEVMKLMKTLKADVELSGNAKNKEEISKEEQFMPGSAAEPELDPWAFHLGMMPKSQPDLAKEFFPIWHSRPSPNSGLFE